MIEDTITVKIKVDSSELDYLLKELDRLENLVDRLEKINDLKLSDKKIFKFDIGVVNKAFDESMKSVLKNN